MSGYEILFYLIGAIIVAATGMALSRRNLMHAVIYLVVAFFATALLFYLLGSPLLAVLEVIIYAGAIMVLFLFIIMLIEQQGPISRTKRMRNRIFPVILGLFTLGFAGLMIYADAAGSRRLPLSLASPARLGEFVYSKYWLAVEVVSILLFVGLVGAYYLGKGQVSGDAEPAPTEPTLSEPVEVDDSL